MTRNPATTPAEEGHGNKRRSDGDDAARFDDQRQEEMPDTGASSSSGTRKRQSENDDAERFDRQRDVEVPEDQPEMFDQDDGSQRPMY